MIGEIVHFVKFSANLTVLNSKSTPIKNESCFLNTVAKQNRNIEATYYFTHSCVSCPCPLGAFSYKVKKDYALPNMHSPLIITIKLTKKKYIPLQTIVCFENNL